MVTPIVIILGAIYISICFDVSHRNYSFEFKFVWIYNAVYMKNCEIGTLIVIILGPMIYTVLNSFVISTIDALVPISKYRGDNRVDQKKKKQKSHADRRVSWEGSKR